MAEKNKITYDKDEYFVIPNPIYDVVFKYLMEDHDSAVIILSTLINEKIISLNFEPISFTHKLPSNTTDNEITLFHLDFTATIQLADGTEELVMIELQKANKASDIFRFKRYISTNFQKKKETEIVNPKTQVVEKVDRPIRLIPIFILNFRIENEVNDLIIRTDRTKTGVFKNKELKKHNDFIDNLTYDLWIVQLPNLANITEEDYDDDEYKMKLYLLLKLFDQKAQLKDNRHRLLLLRKIFPGYLERVIARLKSADADNPDLEEKMIVEDEYLAELAKKDNEISFFKQNFEIAKAKLENVKTKLESAKTKLETTKEALENEKKINEQRLQNLLKLAKKLKTNNIPLSEIIELTGLSLEEVMKL